MADLLQLAGISLDATASSREEAVRICGELLVELGAVDQEYADAMWEREQIFPSEIGGGFAIPHGTDESRVHVKFDQLVFVRFRNPFTWSSEEVQACVGIASQGDGHVELLGTLADLLLDDDSRNFLLTSDDAEAIRQVLITGRMAE
jgi:mannitol/fructose-specific phosphotransferase system IIA component